MRRRGTRLLSEGWTAGSGWTEGQEGARLQAARYGQRTKSQLLSKLGNMSVWECKYGRDNVPIVSLEA